MADRTLLHDNTSWRVLVLSLGSCIGAVRVLKSRLFTRAPWILGTTYSQARSRFNGATAQNRFSSRKILLRVPPGSLVIYVVDSPYHSTCLSFSRLTSQRDPTPSDASIAFQRVKTQKLLIICSKIFVSVTS